MSLNDSIRDLNRVFLSTKLFGELIEFMPGGDPSQGQQVSAVVDWAQEEGNNTIRGDGRSSLNEARGRSIRSTCIIEVNSELSVSDSGKDLFLVPDYQDAGQRVKVRAKRRIGQDAGTQTWICTRRVEHESQTGGGRIG